MQHEFDDLAVALASGQSRRGTLKHLLLGAIGIPAVTLGSVGLSEAEAKKKKKNKNKKKNNKKVTLCHNGQTIKVKQKAKKKHLKHGDTVGPCPETPACTPNANACAGRACGSVDNGCGVDVSCGNCADPEICNTNTGQCGCTPDPNACDGRECGTVDNGCEQEACGPDGGACPGTDTCTAAGQCVCTPDPTVCDGRECGTVDDGCGTPVPCGECTDPETCHENSGQCICDPDPDACAGRECGSVDDGCGQQIQCGECTSPEICKDSTGQCACTPIENPCAGRECGSVDNGCGQQVACGTCNNAITNCQERTCTDGQCGARNLTAGTPCDDGNACTSGTTCQDGVCGGGAAVTCDTPPSECQVSTGTCNPATGDCQYQDLPDDTPCGMNKCNHTCQSGECVNTPVVCSGTDLCHESTCDPNTGTCSAPTPIPCPPAPECKAGAGVCDPGTGQCSYANAADDTPCHMNKCNHTCQAGTCSDTPVVCPPVGECQTSICDPNFGTCSAPVAANQGASCNAGAGVCVNGACEVLTTGNTCNNQSPCAVPVACGAPGSDCVCYSTTEGGNLCIRRSEATCKIEDRPTGCNSSATCGPQEVCAPLDQAGPGTICCDRPDLAGKRGFCVPISAVCPTL